MSGKKIALIAHDNKKAILVDWAREHQERLSAHSLVATGTTGGLLERELGLKVHCCKSGPLGGDLEIGAMVAQGAIDVLVFFWDPLSPHPHDVDVRALLRIAAVYDVPIACNRSTADLLFAAGI